jgi:tetratricopeptide (TPR) repeat protein
MAAQTPGSSTSKTNKPRAKSRPLKWWVFRIVLLVVLCGIGAMGWRYYGEFRKNRMVERARSMIAQKDYPQALISARRALQLNPRDVAVVRMMIELAESSNAKEALFWHRMLAEIEPKRRSADDIAWADCALRFGEAAVAQQAVAGLDEAGKKTAGYQDIAGRFAELANNTTVAESHFAEAVKLEPGNPLFQVRLAAVRLRSGKSELHAESLETLEKFKTEPKARGLVLRALLDEYFRQKDWSKALELAKQMQAMPDATFSDKMLYLGLLRRFQSPEFHRYLFTLQETAITSPDNVAHLITWLKENTLVMVASGWIKTIPPEIAKTTPVPAAIAECYLVLRDWESLNNVVAEGNWGYVEFLRLAFLARVQRENGDLPSSRNSWTGAVKAAENRPDSILMLTRHANKWGWESEVLDMLWAVARSNAGQQPALTALHQSYAATGNTRGLLNVSNRMLEINPKDPVALNNVVLLSLLLNTNVERALSLGDEAYRLDPKNPGIISTYAFSLHVRGKTEEGIALMRTLDEKTLNDPSAAAYFAAMLAESEKPDEAAKYIELAQPAKLLPEEMALVKTAREVLLRRKSEGAAPQ